MLDEQVLKEATRISGEKTYSGAVRKALEEFVRRCRAREILDLQGKVDFWPGYAEGIRRRGRRKR